MRLAQLLVTIIIALRMGAVMYKTISKWEGEKDWDWVEIFGTFFYGGTLYGLLWWGGFYQ